MAYLLLEDQLEMIVIPHLADLLVEDQLLLQVVMSHFPQEFDGSVNQFHPRIVLVSSELGPSP